MNTMYAHVALGTDVAECEPSEGRATGYSLRFYGIFCVVVMLCIGYSAVHKVILMLLELACFCQDVLPMSTSGLGPAMYQRDNLWVHYILYGADLRFVNHTRWMQLDLLSMYNVCITVYTWT